MKKFWHKVYKITNNPIYGILVSISLIVISIYDTIDVIIKDLIHFAFRKDHWILFVAIFMLIHSIASLMKGLRGVEESLEEIKEKEHKETQNA